MGGEVSVRSRKGRGSLWTINIWETKARIQETVVQERMRQPRGMVGLQHLETLEPGDPLRLHQGRAAHE